VVLYHHAPVLLFDTSMVLRHKFKFNLSLYLYVYRNNSVSKVTGYRLDNRISMPSSGLCLHHKVRVESEANPASYPVDTCERSFPRSEAAGA